MKKIIFLFSLAGLLCVPIVAHGQTNAAAETMVFDSTNNYLGGCGYTAASTWTLTKSLSVSKFQMWYYWQANETELPITVTKDGAPFASFTATRSACDPYQTSWCNADFAINKTFPAGTYATTIAHAYQCLKPGGTGTVRLYSLAATANTNTVSANTNRATTNTSVTNKANTNTAVVKTDEATDTEEGGDALTCTLIGIIVILVIVIVVMFMKCQKKSLGK
jgi:hypothetical protein